MRAEPWRIDVVLTGLLLILGLLLMMATGFASAAFHGPLVFALNAPLAIRRRYPTASFTLVSLACLLQLVVLDTPHVADFAFLVACYSVAAHARQPVVRRASLSVAVLAGLLATLDWNQGQVHSPLTVWVETLFLSGLAVICWVSGDLIRRRRELISRLTEQNAALRRDRDQRARIAAQNERTMIAREMHDIVAHNLSVIVVQADGASYAAQHDSSFDLLRAQRALATIAATAREALAETRQLVGVLRDPGSADPADLAPVAGLTDIEDVVDRVRQSGRAITLTRPDDLADIPRDVGLAAYRIAQESITNVLKHAGPAAQANIELSRAATPGGDTLVIVVSDNGHGTATEFVDAGTGNGIPGMRERAVSVGGTLVVGPRPGGGFRVTATLPLQGDLR